MKKTYIKLLELYLCKSSLNKLNNMNIDIEKIVAIDSIKNHIIDLNERNIDLVDKEKWFNNTKNKYRLYSSVYRYIKTKEIIEKYIDIKNNKIVDFGAGNGVFLEFLGLGGVGVDINKKCVEHMKSKGIEAYTVDELSSLENKFDSAFAFEVIEHVENQLMVLKNICEYIKNGGYLFLSIPYVKNSHVLKKQQEDTATKRLENYHIFELDTTDFKNLTTYTDLEIVEVVHLNPHKGFFGVFSIFFDLFFRSKRPKWTIFILKKNKNVK